ncbi:MAG TPA: hypothetical protein PKH31_17265, partial [Candidatus Sumerlaeota bacterium]|nr:hypothetical protein [Candidatus Sumerlaeota bacterium]
MKRWGLSICMLLFCLSSLAQAETSRKAIAFTERGSCDLVDLDSRTILSSFGTEKSKVFLEDALLGMDTSGTVCVYLSVDRDLYRISVRDNSLVGELVEK